MEVLSKKTTILLSPDLHRRLTQLASQQGVSLGELIRSACESQYGIARREARLQAVAALAAMALPVGTPDQMKRESAPAADELLR